MVSGGCTFRFILKDLGVEGWSDSGGHVYIEGEMQEKMLWKEQQ